jgi:hypothetical protein
MHTGLMTIYDINYISNDAIVRMGFVNNSTF